ncbi:MAG: hypothetical protein R3C70_07065 [Geminicoccaceae bacterium]
MSNLPILHSVPTNCRLDLGDDGTFFVIDRHHRRIGIFKSTFEGPSKRGGAPALRPANPKAPLLEGAMV